MAQARRRSKRFLRTPRYLARRPWPRRQHVMPLPQPISWGSISQGMPLRRTKRMPVRAARSGTGGRPPFGLRRRFGSRGLREPGRSVLAHRHLRGERREPRRLLRRRPHPRADASGLADRRAATAQLDTTQTPAVGLSRSATNSSSTRRVANPAATWVPRTYVTTSAAGRLQTSSILHSSVIGNLAILAAMKANFTAGASRRGPRLLLGCRAPS
jgi:hypothetical protein